MNKRSTIIILLFSLLFIITIPYLYIGDDTIFHTSNIIANAKTLNPLPNKILPLIENNLGYGINIFYPPLPHLLGSYINRITNNISITMRLLQFLTIFLSGISMLLYTNKIFKNKKIALLSSILYISMPYLFTDIFTRGALNESLLFIYIPLIFLSYYYLEINNTKKFYKYFIMGFTLSILTHLVLTIYITIFSIIYFLILWKRIINKDNIKKMMIGTIITLLITSFFWIPLLEHYIQNNYIIFIESSKLNQTIKKEILPVAKIIFPIKSISNGFHTLMFYPTPLSLLLLVITYIQLLQNKIEQKNKKYLLSFLLIIIISILLETNSSIWNLSPNFLKNIQFPWRLNLFIAFSISMISSYGINLIKEKYLNLIIVVIIITLCIQNIYHGLSLKKQPVTNYLDTSITEYISYHEEYLTKKAKQNRFGLSNRPNTIIPNENIEIIKEEFPNIVFKNNSKKEITIEFPRLYYLGYELTNSKKEKIKLSESNQGLLEAKINKKDTYTLKYKETPINHIANIFSIIGALIYIKILWKRNTKKCYQNDESVVK